MRRVCAYVVPVSFAAATPAVCPPSHSVERIYTGCFAADGGWVLSLRRLTNQTIAKIRTPPARMAKAIQPQSVLLSDSLLFDAIAAPAAAAPAGLTPAVVVAAVVGGGGAAAVTVCCWVSVTEFVTVCVCVSVCVCVTVGVVWLTVTVVEVVAVVRTGGSAAWVVSVVSVVGLSVVVCTVGTVRVTPVRVVLNAEPLPPPHDVSANAARTPSAAAKQSLAITRTTLRSGPRSRIT
jgi:hypothetical protein